MKAKPVSKLFSARESQEEEWKRHPGECFTSSLKVILGTF